jgi:multidrug efflux system membrane fusion protein
MDTSEHSRPQSFLRIGRLRALLLLAGIIAILIIGWLWVAESRRAAAAAPKAPAAVQVDAVAANRVDVPVYLEGLGTIQALYTDTITARVDGQLQKIGFTEGQMVDKGALLAQIDPRPYQAALNQAIATQAKDAAQLASAKRDLDRYAILAPQDLTSKQTVDDQRGVVAALEAQVKSDQATVESARTQLDYTRITSPIQGRTGIRLIDPGNIVRSTDTRGIVVVTQVQPISCMFTLPEEAVAAINAALGAGPVTVTAMSRDGKSELDRGRVALIDNQIDQTTGTIRVKAQFPNAQNTLWPGEFVNARVLVRTEHNALSIPSIAVQHGVTGLFTYVVKADSTVEARAIKVGEEVAGLTVIEGGLQEGEQVVTSNQFRLQPGTRVQRATPPKPAAATVAVKVP